MSEPLMTQKFDVENIPVKLEHGTCNFWGFISFTRQLDRELVWKFKQVKKGQFWIPA